MFLFIHSTLLLLLLLSALSWFLAVATSFSFCDYGNVSISAKKKTKKPPKKKKGKKNKHSFVLYCGCNFRWWLWMVDDVCGRRFYDTNDEQDKSCFQFSFFYQNSALFKVLNLLNNYFVWFFLFGSKRSLIK